MLMNAKRHHLFAVAAATIALGFAKRTPTPRGFSR